LLSTSRDIEEKVDFTINFTEDEYSRALVLNDINTTLNDESSLLLSGRSDEEKVNIHDKQDEIIQDPSDEISELHLTQTEHVNQRHFFNLYGSDDDGILNDTNDWLPDIQIKDEYFAFMKVPWFIVAPEPSIPTLQGILNEPSILLNSSKIIDINWAGTGKINYCKFNQGVFGQKTLSEG
jgi:hypothetical protein